MSRGKNLFLMVIALMIMVGLYYYFSNKTANNNEETDPEHIDSIALHEFQNRDIKRLLLKKKEKEIILINGETPTIDGLSDVQLNTVKLYHIVNSFANLTADRLVVKNTEDIAKYGLDKPNVNVIADIKGMDPIILHVGNKTVDGKNYYIRLDEDDTVYLIQSYIGNNFMIDIADLRDATLPNIDPQFIRYLYIEPRENKPIEVVYKKDIDAQKAAYGIGLFSLIQPYNIPREIDYSNLDKIIKGIPLFKAEKFVDDHPVDLSVYGLDNPVLRLKMESKNEETNISKDVHILFGNTFDDNYVYFKYADKDNIYGMKRAFMESLLDITPFDIADKFIYVVNIKEIKKLEVSINDSSYIFEMKESITEDEEKGNQLFLYKGNQLDEEVFRGLYQLIIGIAADEEVNQVNDATGNETFNITYTFKDDTKKSIAYKSYNDLFYSHQVEDNIYFLSSSKQIHAIKVKLEEMINK